MPYFPSQGLDPFGGLHPALLSSHAPGLDLADPSRLFSYTQSNLALSSYPWFPQSNTDTSTRLPKLEPIDTVQPTTHINSSSGLPTPSPEPPKEAAFPPSVSSPQISMSSLNSFYNSIYTKSAVQGLQLPTSPFPRLPPYALPSSLQINRPVPVLL